MLTIFSERISTKPAPSLKLYRSLFRTNVLYKKKSDELLPFQALPDLHNSSINPMTHAQLLQMPVEPCPQSKLLRVAILGIPNSGKSTLVNKLVGHQICPESQKPNTTRKNAKAILTSGETQVVFLDTPGVMEDGTATKFQIEKTLLLDPELSCREVDMLVVLHDVSNRYVREALNKKVLRLLCLYYRNVPSILVLNKMDTIPKSRRMFDLIRKLTCNRLDGEEGQVKISKHDSRRSIDTYLKRKERGEEELLSSVKRESDVLEVARRKRLTEEETSNLITGLIGWPGFTDVFTVSALKGDGVNDLKEYLLKTAKPGVWDYPGNVKFDDDPRNVVINIVKSKFLDYLPHRIPYELMPEIQMWEVDEDWNSLRILVTVDAKNKNIFKLLLGYKGQSIKAISDEIQSCLIDFFSHEVHFKLSVIPKFTTVVEEKEKRTVKPNLYL